MQKALLIDTDTASDDAVALIMALRHPQVRVAGISVVSGNVPLPQAVANALYTVELCGKADSVPVFAGSSRPLLREPAHAQWFHGRDGLGDMNYPAARCAAGSKHGVDAIIETIAANPGIVLVTLGPLTNIALAVAREPAIVKNVSRCVVMGGNPCCEGNVTPAAEYNIWCDPEAARIVFRSGLPIEMVGWQLCRGEANLRAADIAQVRAIGSELANFAIDANRVAMQANRTQSGEIGIALPDPIAMSIALEPSITIEASDHAVEIETVSELTRGMTVVDRLNVSGDDRNRGLWSRSGNIPRARVVWRIDIPKWKRLLVQALSAIVFLVLLLHTGSTCAAAAEQAIVLDAGTAQKVFEGVGAVSGGGGTSVLLKDYPKPQRDQILDLLFKPNFGASMQTLYVEVGGDGNSTQGSEPSHMRSRNDENYSRGYEWWLMREAVARNPKLTLDACAWSCPGWVGDGQFWSQDMADYYVKWIKGLKSHYGLDLDAIGCRNERGAVIPWVKRFRRTLDENGLKQVRIHAFDNPGNKWMWDWIPSLQTDPELSSALNIISNHCLTAGPWPREVQEAIRRSGKPLWNTEEHVYNADGREFKDDFECALGAVHLFNDNFISRGATKIVNWYLVGSTYAIDPYSQQPPAMFARSPWSGHYSIKPIVWAYAHYGQFTKIGWRYVSSGCEALSGGGTVVTLKSDDDAAQADYSIIAETAGAKSPQRVSFKIGSGLSRKKLCVWRTTRQEQFVRQPDLMVSSDGSLTLTLEPEAIYSFSTTNGQQKGSFGDVPDEKPFPFPYFETFDHYTQPSQWGYLPHYTADICGVFEVVDRPDHAGKCLRQMLDRAAQSWAPEWKPYTIIGDDRWTDCEVSADVFFDDRGWAGVMGRVCNTGNGWDGNPDGYYARLYPDGGCALYLASAKLKGPREQQIGIGEARNWKWNQWHNLKLRFVGHTITVLVDNVPVITAENDQYSHGLAGLVTAGEGKARHTALFDNLLINRVEAGPVEPTVFPQDASPIYP